MTIRIDFKQDGHLTSHKTYKNIHPGSIEIVNNTLWFSHDVFKGVAKYQIDIDHIYKLTTQED